MFKQPSPSKSSVFSAIIVVFCMILMIAVSSCKPRPSAAQSFGGGMTLDKAVSKLADKLTKMGTLTGEPVFISPLDFYDAQSELSLPLAKLLREKMIAEMREAGVRVLLPGADEDRYMILQGTWQRQKDRLYLNMKIMKLGPDGPEVISAASVNLPFDAVDPDLMKPDRDSWGRYLVRKLEKNTDGHNRRTVHIRNFKVVRSTGATVDSEGYFPGWLRPALNESRLFKPLDQLNAMKGISVETIRTRGIETRPVQENTGLTTDLLVAEAELRGAAWIHDRKGVVEIQLQIKKRQGADFSSATADIPADLFPNYIINPPSPPPLPPAPIEKVNTGGNVSINGLTVELSTTRGEGQPYYGKGEKMRFVIRLNRTARLYLFDLDPTGRVSLLYPVDPNTGRLVQGEKFRVIPGKPIVLPEDGASFEMVATEPFGKDTVWAVASEIPLSIPEQLTGQWAMSDVLIENIRKQGFSSHVGYAEDQLKLVTGP